MIIRAIPSAKINTTTAVIGVIGPPPFRRRLDECTLFVVPDAQLTRRCALQVTSSFLVPAEITGPLVARLVRSSTINGIGLRLRQRLRQLERSHWEHHARWRLNGVQRRHVSRFHLRRKHTE